MGPMKETRATRRLRRDNRRCRQDSYPADNAGETHHNSRQTPRSQDQPHPETRAGFTRDRKNADVNRRFW